MAQADISVLLKLMKASYIGAYIIAGLTFLMAMLTGGYVLIVDTVIIGLCGSFIMHKKSRVAAIVLFLFYLAGMLYKIAVGANIGLSPLFLLLFACGVYGTIMYHRKYIPAEPEALEDLEDKKDTNLFS